MGKRGRPKKNAGEQLDLIDVNPENAKPIIEVARLYKQFQTARLAMLKKELAAKQQLLTLVREAHLTPLEGGIIRFSYDDVTISTTPQEEKLKVTVSDE